VKQAVVYVSGLGQYELHLNGKDVAAGVMNPGWTNYRKTVLYNAYDVTGDLRPGENAFGVMLGNGMYNVPGIKGRYTKFIGSFGQPKLILQMHVLYADGTTSIFVSDGKWKTTPGPIVLSSIYGGEDYDARREPEAGWDQPGFSAENWTEALEVNGPNGKSDPGSELTAQAIPPIRIDRTFKPVKVSEPRPGITVYDLGQNFSGWPVLTVQGRAGDIVRTFPGELLDANGLVTQASGGGDSDAATYFTYTLRGGGTETWHPRFSYYGFRYVQVERTAASGPDGAKPALLSLEGAFVHSAVDTVGEFATSQPLLEHIHQLIDRAILSNTQTLSTDCPTREKLGWLEQTQLAATSIQYNYDVARLYEKISDDIRDAQFPSGFVPTIAPEYVAFVFQNGVNTDFRDSPEWGSAVILSPWAAYQIYGDRDNLARHYAEMQHYAEYLKTKLHNGILSYGLGDWYDIGPKFPGESQLTDKGVTATATDYQDLDALAKIAQVLGKSADSALYAAEALTVKDAFNRRYFHPGTDTYDRNSQTANAMALTLGMVPDDHRLAVLSHLVEDIRAHSDHVTAGDVGFHYVVRALTDGGRSDVLTDMLLRTDPPSYGDQLAKGATSLTEAWDSNPASSQNHLMLGHAEEWFYRGLVGIDFDLSRPAGEQIVIRPAFVDQVPEASARFDSVLGFVSSRWARQNGSIQLDIAIPAGAAARIEISVKPGQTVHGDTGELRAAGRDGMVAIKVGSGSYHFVIQ
jgi:hypothetical protein